MQKSERQKELNAKSEADLLQKQKEEELKNKQVIKNMSTRELVLQ